MIGSKQPRVSTIFYLFFLLFFLFLLLLRLQVVSVASLLPARRRVSPSPWVFFILVDSGLARGGDWVGLQASSTGLALFNSGRHLRCGWASDREKHLSSLRHHSPEIVSDSVLIQQPWWDYETSSLFISTACFQLFNLKLASRTFFWFRVGFDNQFFSLDLKNWICVSSIIDLFEILLEIEIMKNLLVSVEFMFTARNHWTFTQ